MNLNKPLQKDTWNWGTETILWGFEPSHQYTFKMLEPRVGRAGCLSLQYHNEKSESWFILEGIAWALMIVDGEVCTRILRKGDVQSLPTGVIHRLMAVSSDLKVLEPSTPDRHAADKDAPKDVVRLHCVFGRECSKPRDETEKVLVAKAIEVTEEAIFAIESGSIPAECSPDLSRTLGSWNVFSSSDSVE